MGSDSDWFSVPYLTSSIMGAVGVWPESDWMTTVCHTYRLFRGSTQPHVNVFGPEPAEKHPETPQARESNPEPASDCCPLHQVSCTHRQPLNRTQQPHCVYVVNTCVTAMNVGV